MTTLAWARIGEETDGSLKPEPQGLTRPTETELIFFSHQITDGNSLGLKSVRDRLAERRVAKLVGGPRTGLLAIQRQAAASLRRPTRPTQPALSHGGQISGEALSATLRTVARVGAGLDRIAHAALTSNTAPLDLAARARFEVERAGSEAAPEDHRTSGVSCFLPKPERGPAGQRL